MGLTFTCISVCVFERLVEFRSELPSLLDKAALYVLHVNSMMVVVLASTGSVSATKLYSLDVGFDAWGLRQVKFHCHRRFCAEGWSFCKNHLNWDGWQPIANQEHWWRKKAYSWLRYYIFEHGLNCMLFLGIWYSLFNKCLCTYSSTFLFWGHRTIPSSHPYKLLSSQGCCRLLSPVCGCNRMAPVDKETCFHICFPAPKKEGCGSKSALKAIAKIAVSSSLGF